MTLLTQLMMLMMLTQDNANTHVKKCAHTHTRAVTDVTTVKYKHTLYSRDQNLNAD